MDVIKVPHIPIDEFNLSEFTEKIAAVKKPESVTEQPANLNLDRNDPYKDICLILHGMGMENYLEIFQNKKIELDAFLNLNEIDLLELGIHNRRHINIILKDLKNHKNGEFQNKIIDSESDDLTIANNVYNQLVVLQNYCAYVELQMKKYGLKDYNINTKETALLYLKRFTESALLQAEIMADKLYSESKPDHLIGKVVKAANLKLPRHLEKKLQHKKKPQKNVFLKAVVVIGFSSMILLVGKYLCGKK